MWFSIPEISRRAVLQPRTLSVAIGLPVPTKRLVKPSAIRLGFSFQGSLVQNQNEGPAMMQACLVVLSAVKTENTLMTIDVDVDVTVASVRSIIHENCHAAARKFAKSAAM